MPLARIITDCVEDSLELTMQLRARGFQVETVAPDQIPSTPADLEVRLEECGSEDVLSKAAQVKESEDLWVFVAPGALDDRARPIRTIPLTVPAMARPEPKVIASRAETILPAEFPLVAPQEHNTSQAVPTAEIHRAVEKGVAKIELTSTVAAAEPPVVPLNLPGKAKPTAELSSAKMKLVVLAKLPDLAIPEVPEQAIPANLTAATTATTFRARRTGPYKIAFRIGPRFWKRAAVSMALLVMTGLLVAVVGLRPPLPASGKSVPAATPQIFFPAAKPSSAPAIASRPVAAAPVEPVGKASAKAAQDKPLQLQQGTSTPAPKDEHRHRAITSRDEGIIAEDTVVFYDRKPGTSPQKRPTQPGTKRYSDMN